MGRGRPEGRANTATPVSALSVDQISTRRTAPDAGKPAKNSLSAASGIPLNGRRQLPPKSWNSLRPAGLMRG